MAVPVWATRSISAVVLVLVTIGVAAAIGRVVFPADLLQRFEPMRAGYLAAWGREDPLALQRPAEVARMDRPFAEHRFLTLLHVVPGALFFVFAPLQFSGRLRGRRPNLHRWSGRILLVVATISLLPGLFFGILMPFGGAAEAVTIAAVGVFFLYSMTTAFIAIRRGEVTRHREWMLRMFSIAIAISTVRLIGGPIDFVLVPYGIAPPDLFVISIWAAWLLTIGGAECWIRYTRPRPARLTVSPSGT